MYIIYILYFIILHTHTHTHTHKIYTIIIIQYNKYNKIIYYINEKLLILRDIFLHSSFTLPFSCEIKKFYLILFK